MPARSSQAITSACTMASVCVKITSRWRLVRSTNTPATGARKKVGICPANPTTPNHHGDLVKSQTSHAKATCCIQVPTSEIVWPAKKRRKLRLPSARNASGQFMSRSVG